MENFVSLLIPALLLAVLFRILLTPVRLCWKLGLHTATGFLCLWLLNSVSGITGLYLPINAVTALIAGILGVPGIGLVAVMEMI